jgi:murein DD-endopeptidase MepM/ murein hydrolase activator NlpD
MPKDSRALCYDQNMQKIMMILMTVAFLGAGCSSETPRQTVGPAMPEAAVVPFRPLPVPEPSTPEPELSPELIWPISRAEERITKKSFGTYVTPKNSPVSPEKFTGYHTGIDFEILEGEKDADVPVVAVCSGKLLRASTASGYGGYLVQSCVIDGKDVTVVYGHLRLSSVTPRNDQIITVGEKIGLLGTGYSKETDGERKHLHLSIHRGSSVNIRGYVSTSAGLKDWIDLRKLLKD